MFNKYVARLCADIERSQEIGRQMGGLLPSEADSIYFGGGTPTLLDVSQLERVFVTIRQNFEVLSAAEITMECAPGTLSAGMIECFERNRVNRVSLGVQSFVDQEARSVGRLHNRETVLEDIARLRSAGVSNINVDLIAGLPHQTRESWERSLDVLIATGVPHASIYMLEVDADSRLGRELIRGGQKYHAHFVPDEDLITDLQERACERLNAAGIQQYEISNFARNGFESKHNLKYWTRQPYIGFGVDAHSMLMADSQLRDVNAVRFSNPDNLDAYSVAAPAHVTVVSREAALEEAYFLGLRLTRGVHLRNIAAEFVNHAIEEDIIAECIASGLMEQQGDVIRLTPKGRLLSNEVFEKFVSTPATQDG